ncbi:MAG: DUF438 domain-containing protein [Firmicutes bacterium]|nr:DUF438 domain-containing protein [Bacillota bacterium]
MSEFIDNREYRQKILKELIMELHDGKSVEEVKERFAEAIEGITTAEISAMEQSLIEEGMPVEEIQRLCDVHAAVFKGSIAEIHREEKPEEKPGHPIYTFRRENEKIQELLDQRLRPHLKAYEEQPGSENLTLLKQDLENLWEIDKHYSRKENLLFPYLEKAGITAPPQVMWGVDDEIRDELKEVLALVDSPVGEPQVLVKKAQALCTRVEDMIFKEESILFPLALETLAEGEWHSIASESDEIGYCLYEPEKTWGPRVDTAKDEVFQKQPGYVSFATGSLTAKEINAIFNHLPVDITYIDKDDVVKYFSQSPERLFARTKAVIGRTVQNCHPPASVHVVEKLLADFKSGAKDEESFWIKMGDLYVLIRYFAIRDSDGQYMGTMEVTQNIKPIQEISGEKRLLSEVE